MSSWDDIQWNPSYLTLTGAGRDWNTKNMNNQRSKNIPFTNSETSIVVKQCVNKTNTAIKFVLKKLQIAIAKSVVVSSAARFAIQARQSGMHRAANHVLRKP